MKKIVRIVVILLLLCVFLGSGWKLASTLLEYRKGEVFYEDLTQCLAEPETEPLTQTPSKPAEETQIQDTRPKVDFMEVDFAGLQAVSEDVVGWLYIPDTQISYPIAQGSNNDQYLYRLMSGEYNAAGTIFLDAGASRDFSGSLFTWWVIP